MLHIDGCRDMDEADERINFEPDPDYSPDARTGLLSPISFALQRGILLRRENPTYAFWRGRSLQRGVVLKWFYSPRTVGTPLSEVCALYRVPSSLSLCRPFLNISLYDKA